MGYYSRLQSARKFLEEEVETEKIPPRPNTRNKRLLENITFLQGLTALTDEDQEYLALLYQAVSQSALAKKTIKRLADVCNISFPNSLALFNAFRKVLPPKDLKGLSTEDEAATKTVRKPRQIVLCQYLAPLNKECL